MYRLFAPLLFLILGLPLAQAADKLGCAAASQIINYSLRNHLIYRSLNAEVADRITAQFTTSLLGYKGLLIEADRVAIEQELAAADKQLITAGMVQGNCTFFEIETQVLRTAFTQLRNTFKSPDALRQEILLNQGRELNLSAATPKTLFELRARTIDGLSRKAAIWAKDVEPEAAADFVARTFLNNLDRFAAILPELAYNLMLTSFTISLDPHSVYHVADESESWLNSLLSSKSVGVGISLSLAPTPRGARVNQVSADGSAGRTGQIFVGDTVTAIDSKSIIGLAAGDVIDLLRGPVNSTVTLTVAQIKNRELVNIRTVPLVREEIKKSAEQVHVSRKLIRGKSVVTVRLRSFYSGSAIDVRKYRKAKFQSKSAVLK